jgi:hypothetical protein
VVILIDRSNIIPRLVRCCGASEQQCHPFTLPQHSAVKSPHRTGSCPIMRGQSTSPWPFFVAHIDVLLARRTTVEHPSQTRFNFFTMLWASLLAFAALAESRPWYERIYKRQGGTTMLRFGCAQVVIDRLDPLVNPGSVPSPHQHQIVGGNGFNASMTTGDVSGTASCTTCAFSKDLYVRTQYIARLVLTVEVPTTGLPTSISRQGTALTSV